MTPPSPKPPAAERGPLEGYERHALSPHGRLRHELLFRYYDEFLAGRGIRRIVDIGGASGFLAKSLLEKYTDLTVVLIDIDEAMIEKAKERFSAFVAAGRAEMIVGEVNETPRILSSLSINEEPYLIAFNHTIEYVDDKVAALHTLAGCVPEGSYLGIMYLNNSHEAFRQFVYHESIGGLLDQLENRRLNMGHFGQAIAIETRELEDQLQKEGLTLITEYGIRSIADLRKPDFVEQHYEELLKADTLLGKQKDFMGLARYRLSFYQR